VYVGYSDNADQNVSVGESAEQNVSVGESVRAC